jgi:hypothetical protein
MSMGYMVASAQQCPASFPATATATATIVRRLPRCSSVCQRWWRRRALWSARARASPYPVGPASEATRTGPANRRSHSTVSPGNVGARKLRSSPHQAHPQRPCERAHPTRPTYPQTSPAPPVIAATPPRHSRRQPAPTYERGAGSRSIRSSRRSRVGKGCPRPRSASRARRRPDGSPASSAATPARSVGRVRARRRQARSGTAAQRSHRARKVRVREPSTSRLCLEHDGRNY